ncbi:hypothetical protein [Streptococcus ovis]|uniref:hypothetical protein n=1 Tax=Streptococcus ovis TaxID=82806 RepID=UPI00037052DF|nr:hypothetical protein [Streptococcus ovis]
MKPFQSKTIVLTAILTAFGILIPLMMPVKIVIGPASFTLASHVPIFLAIFISTPIAIMVTLGTALGFLFAGFPIVIVFRALSHIIFAAIGAILLQKFSKIKEKSLPLLLLILSLNLLHGLAEFFVVFGFTATTNMTVSYLWSLFLLVGIGSFIHGTIDFYIAYYLKNILSNKVGIDFSLER